MHMDIVKKYWDNLYLYLILYTPLSCMCAGAYYTLSWLQHVYPNLSFFWIAVFDITHFIYLCISLWFIYQKNYCKKPILSLLPLIKAYATISFAIQFNFIIHLFPSRYVWACIFVFLLPIAFFSDYKMMAFNSMIYVISLFIGHILHPEEYLSKNTPHYELEVLYHIILIIIAITFQLTLAYFFEHFFKRTILEEEENRFLTEQQLKHYEHLNIMDKELRRFRHDINNHFLCLQVLLEKEQFREAIAYFEDLKDSFQNKQDVYLSGNVIIDSILNYHLYQLKDLSVTPMIYGKLSEQITIPQMDLCTVFSNILSNAILATKSCHKDEPELIIHFEHGNQFFSIEVTNTSNQKNVNEPHTLRNTADRNHGHGIYQIHEIVEKYEGIFEQKIENGKFHSKVILPIHPNFSPLCN